MGCAERALTSQVPADSAGVPAYTPEYTAVADDEKKTVYFVEVLASKSADEVATAIKTMTARINCLHKTQAVFRVHADRAQELSGAKIAAQLAHLNVYVTATAGYEPNSNGRAENGIKLMKSRVRALIHDAGPGSEAFWPFAAIHVAELLCRERLAHLLTF